MFTPSKKYSAVPVPDLKKNNSDIKIKVIKRSSKDPMDGKSELMRIPEEISGASNVSAEVCKRKK